MMITSTIGYSTFLRSLFIGLFVVNKVAIVDGFSHYHPTAWTSSTLRMGMFDFIADAFKNEKYEDRFAVASHILVDTKDECLIVQKDINNGSTSFEDAARAYSKCPSSSKGGDLGKFQPGQMVQEFDDVVFDETNTKIGEVYGPIQTQFGYHLIKVIDRTVN